MSDEQAIETRAREILNRYLEYANGLERGQVMMKTSNALAAVKEAIATPPVTGEVGELVEARDLLSKASSWLAMDSVVNHGDLVQQIDAFLARTSGTLPPTEQPS